MIESESSEDDSSSDGVAGATGDVGAAGTAGAAGGISGVVSGTLITGAKGNLAGPKDFDFDCGGSVNVPKSLRSQSDLDLVGVCNAAGGNAGGNAGVNSSMLSPMPSSSLSDSKSSKPFMLNNTVVYDTPPLGGGEGDGMVKGNWQGFFCGLY